MQLKLSYFVILSSILTASALFGLKRNVEILANDLTYLHKKIDEQREIIHILETEYAYLTSPERISYLAENYLNLQKISTHQIAGDPLRAPAKPFCKKEVQLAGKVKWRYKKGPEQYLIMVSEKK